MSWPSVRDVGGRGAGRRSRDAMVIVVVLKLSYDVNMRFECESPRQIERLSTVL